MQLHISEGKALEKAGLGGSSLPIGNGKIPDCLQTPKRHFQLFCLQASATVHSTPAQILANAQLMLRPDTCWEQHH